MSDHVPLSIAQFAHCLCLGGKFLHPVLAKDANSSLICLTNVPGWKSLADGQEPDLLWIASGAASGSGNALMDMPDVFSNRHGRNLTTEDTEDCGENAELRRQNAEIKLTVSAHSAFCILHSAFCILPSNFCSLTSHDRRWGRRVLRTARICQRHTDHDQRQDHQHDESRNRSRMREDDR